jgi:hypothetical protein
VGASIGTIRVFVSDYAGNAVSVASVRAGAWRSYRARVGAVSTKALDLGCEIGRALQQ